MSANQTEPRRINGRHVAFGFVAFFGFIVVVDAILITIAVSTFGGLETTDAYRKGLAYNDRIAAERRMATLGWTGTTSFDKGKGQLYVSITGSDSRQVPDLTIKAIVGRPATNQLDREMTLSVGDNGAYTAPWSDAEPGTWTVTTVATQGGEVVFRAKDRIWIAP